jgi:hypothetical protein
MGDYWIFADQDADTNEVLFRTPMRPRSSSINHQMGELTPAETCAALAHDGDKLIYRIQTNSPYDTIRTTGWNLTADSTLNDTKGFYDMAWAADGNLYANVYDSGYKIQKFSGWSTTVSSTLTSEISPRGCGLVDGDLLHESEITNNNWRWARMDGFSLTRLDYRDRINAEAASGVDMPVGKIVLSNTNREVVSPVLPKGSDYVQVTVNQEKTGGGTAFMMFLRGSASSFAVDAGSPSWSRYTPGDYEYQTSWNYFQIKIAATTTTA